MVRAGSRALSIFTSTLNARVLHAHADRPLRIGELEQQLGWAPQSSLRAAIGKLCDLGALTRHEPGEGSSGAATELTAAGCELLPVAEALEHWLRLSPDGPVPLEDDAAHGIVRTLTAAWDSTVVRALAERPLTLTELSAGISDLNYPALKRRLAKLRSTHLVTPVLTESGSAYAATDWLRRAVVPLAVAGRWELEHDVDAEPISRIEVEAAFLLALPLVELSGRSTGACALAVLTSDDGASSKQQVAGVAVEVKQGTIVTCRMDTATTQPTWALGTADAWLEAVVDGNPNTLRISGAKPRLARSIVKALHAGLLRS